jgi:hypothetical protein
MQWNIRLQNRLLTSYESCLAALIRFQKLPKFRVRKMYTWKITSMFNEYGSDSTWKNLCVFLTNTSIDVTTLYSYREEIEFQ